MIRIWVIFLVFIAFGCARLSVETKEPIKVDINMRVDVYQHVVKDVESIEDEIYGDNQKQLNFNLIVLTAYADDYPASVRSAIERRKERADRIEVYLEKGYAGEDRRGYLELIDKNIPSNIKEEAQVLIDAENKDRKIIYTETAEKNGVTVEQIEKVFFNDHYQRAPSGYWFQALHDGKYQWMQK